jgi:hypothetical protein
MTTKEHLLSCLAEECCEVGQRVSKALRFGLEEIQPGQNQTNAQRIVYEFTDLLAVFDMLGREKIIDASIDPIALAKKMSKVQKYIEFAKSKGTLTD